MKVNNPNYLNGLTVSAEQINAVVKGGGAGLTPEQTTTLDKLGGITSSAGEIDGVVTKINDVTVTAADINNSVTQLNNLLYSPNLFNTSLFRDGYFYNDADGVLYSMNIAWGNSAVSGLQEVEPNTLYTFTSGNSLYSIHEYDSSGVWIKRHEPVSSLTTSSTTKFLGLLWLNGGVAITGFNVNIKTQFMINKNTILPTVASGLISKNITIKNSDKITIFGNSYTEGYTMLKKHYIDILSMFSDYQFRNYGKSGDDLLRILARVRSNNTAFGNVPLSEFGTTYGIIACRDNNTETYNLDIDTYYENAKKLAIAIETLGAIPILSTEHQKFNYLFNSFERLSRERGYLFMNWATFANKSFNNNYFQPLWHSNHPATRTTWLWANGMRKYIDSLPRPKQSIKLFRVRSSIDTASLRNMLYETINDRAKIYEEFIIGSTVLTSATDKYFDRLQEATSYSQVASEYLSLQMKTSVTAGSYMMGEFILPFSSTDLTSVTVNVNITGLSNVYIKKTMGLTKYLSSVGTDTTYLSKFKDPVGEWTELSIVDGKIEIPSSYFINSINFDKFSLLFKGTLLAISDISVDCTGYKEKTTIKTPLLLSKSGTELLTSTLLDDGTNWNSINTYTKVVPQVGVDNSTELFPSGITTVRSLSSGEILSQSMSTVSDDYLDTKVQIKILCRYFPTYVSTDALFATSVILRGSFDCAKIEIGLETSGINVKCGEELVGLYWQEVIVEGVLDYRGNILKIKSLDKTIQIAKVSVIKL